MQCPPPKEIPTATAETPALPPSPIPAMIDDIKKVILAPDGGNIADYVWYTKHVNGKGG
ncbi:MAG: hypothetical protein PHO54_01890 [Candidatus Peribacteraceae bacterium]|nr:hypothetical protein [Candidatus Peribacteraceae bacterium]